MDTAFGRSAIPGPLRPAVTSRQIEVFRAVMLTGSVTRAAEALGSSQPTTSRMLRELERAVGFALFVRDRRRMIPTAEGRALFQEVEESFVGLERIARAAAALAGFRHGHLRVIGVSSIAVGPLATAITRFRARYPEASATLEISSFEGTVSRILAGQADVGFAVVPARRAEVRIEPLVTVEGVCVLPAGHPLAARPLVEAQDLEGEAFVSLGEQFPSRPRIDRMFAEAGVTRRLVVETQTGVVACALVRAGAGVTVIDPFSPRAVAGPGLAVRPFRPVVPFAYSTILPADRPPSRMALALVALTREVAVEAASVPAA